MRRSLRASHHLCRPATVCPRRRCSDGAVRVNALRLPLSLRGMATIGPFSSSSSSTASSSPPSSPSPFPLPTVFSPVPLSLLAAYARHQSTPLSSSTASAPCDGFDVDLQVLDALSCAPQQLRLVYAPSAVEQKKNRYSDVLPSQPHTPAQSLGLFSLHRPILALLSPPLCCPCVAVWADASSLLRLRRFAGVWGSSYVNASLVSPQLFPFPCCAYIAAQAPLPSVFSDFWHLLWEQGVELVVMLTREKERWKGGEESYARKADRYWPEEEEGEVQVGRLYIACTHTDSSVAHVVARHFALRLEGERKAGDPEGGGEGTGDEAAETRSLVHLHYTGWPDHGVPPDVASFADFFAAYRRVRAGRAEAAAPIAVHCSAGIGRTGTFIAIDLLLDQIDHLTHLQRPHSSSAPSTASSPAASDAAASVSVLHTVRLLRQSRPGMVQTKGQYAFIYHFVAHALHERLYTQHTTASHGDSDGDAAQRDLPLREPGDG